MRGRAHEILLNSKGREAGARGTTHAILLKAFGEEALALHLAGMAKDGEAVPEPSSLDVVMTDRENRDAVAVLVSVRGAVPRAVRINITAPQDVLARVDACAARRGVNRSGLLVHAAKREMEHA